MKIAALLVLLSLAQMGLKRPADRQLVYDLHPDHPPYVEVYRSLGLRVYHLHWPEELIGGGWRKGRFIHQPLPVEVYRD